MPPQISISELYSIKNKKDLSKHASYDIIIGLCHKKIKKIAEAGGMNIFYEVPYIIIWLPLYNISICIEYVVSSLRKNGLLVQILPYHNNNILYISWSPNDVNLKPTKYLENTNNKPPIQTNINTDTNNQNRTKFLELSKSNKKQFRF